MAADRVRVKVRPTSVFPLRLLVASLNAKSVLE